MLQVLDRTRFHQAHRIMPVAKVIELLAEGDSIEAATEAAVEEASKTVDNIQNVYVDDYRAVVRDGEIQKYRIDAKVTFVLRQ